MTTLLPAGPAGIAAAARLLRAGQLVAFGTETVYGLGARADDATAVASIYAAKRRPAHNPLICHYATRHDAAIDAVFSAAALRLAAAFWPGPLTLVLPRRAAARVVPALAPPGTIAVRVPAPEAARALLAEAAVPVAAPSANLSGRISPTTARHVLDQLDGRIAAVLDCGPCSIGLESTVIDLTAPAATLLRPGFIDAAAIEAALGAPLAARPAAAPTAGAMLAAPGQLPSHYAPLLPLRLHAPTCGPDEALLAFGPPPLSPAGPPGALYQLSATADLAQAAARLFDGLRWLDQQAAQNGLRGIAAMDVPRTGLGQAINDRLARAAHADRSG